MTHCLVVALLLHQLTAPLVKAYHGEVTPTRLTVSSRDGQGDFPLLRWGANLRPHRHSSPHPSARAGTARGNPGWSKNGQDRFADSHGNLVKWTRRVSDEPPVVHQIIWVPDLYRGNSGHKKLQLSRADHTSLPLRTRTVPNPGGHMAKSRQFVLSLENRRPLVKEDTRTSVDKRSATGIIDKTGFLLTPLQRNSSAAHAVKRRTRAVPAWQAQKNDGQGEVPHNITLFTTRGPKQGEILIAQRPSASRVPNLPDIQTTSPGHASVKPLSSRALNPERSWAKMAPILRSDAHFEQGSRQNVSDPSRSTDFTRMSLAAAIFSNLSQKGEGIQTMLKGKPDPVTAFLRHAGRNPGLERAFPSQTDDPDLRDSPMPGPAPLSLSDVRLLDDSHNVTGAYETPDLKGDNCSLSKVARGMEGWPLSERELGLGTWGKDAGLIDCMAESATTRGQYQSAVTVLYSVAIPSLCPLGLAGNALITLLSVRAKLLPLCLRHCLLAMVVANSGLLLCELLHSVNVLVNQRYPLAGNHMTAHLYLPVYQYLSRAFANASPLLLLLLALERLFAVSRPLTRAHTLTTRHAMQLAIFVYVTSFALYLPRMFQLQFTRVQQDNQTWYHEKRTSWASGSYFRQMYPILQHVFRVWIPGLALLLTAVVGSVLLIRTRQRQVALKRLALHAGNASRRIGRLLSSLAAIVMLSMLYVGAVLPEVTAELLSMTDTEFQLLGCRHYQKMLLGSVASLVMVVYAASPCPVFLAACPRLRRALAQQLRPKASCTRQVWSAPLQPRT